MAIYLTPIPHSGGHKNVAGAIINLEIFKISWLYIKDGDNKLKPKLQLSGSLCNLTILIDLELSTSKWIFPWTKLRNWAFVIFWSFFIPQPITTVSITGPPTSLFRLWYHINIGEVNQNRTDGSQTIFYSYQQTQC